MFGLKRSSTPFRLAVQLKKSYSISLAAAHGYLRRDHVLSLDRAEVDAYSDRASRLADKVRRENETRYSPAGVRERLLARRDQRS